MPKADQINFKRYHKQLERMAQQSKVSSGQRTNSSGDQKLGSQVDLDLCSYQSVIKAFYCIMINSTSKMRVALGGMGPCPRGPYPMSEEMVSLALCRRSKRANAGLSS